MGTNTYTSFADLSADGDTAAADNPAEINDVGVFLGSGGATFGSGTLKAQVSFDGGTTYLDVPSATFTSGTAGKKKADYTVIGPKMRWNLAGSTSPTLKLRQVAREVRRAVVLRTSFTADGTYVFAIPSLNTAESLRLVAAFAAQGTWGSGTLALEISPDGGTTWFNIDSLSANGIKHIAAADMKDPVARLSLTGATGPSLTAWVVLPVA